MRKRVEVTVLVVLALAAVSIASGSASAAPRSCGTVQAKYPSGATHGYGVKVTKGTIACSAADKLMTGVYLASGVASTGPNNTSQIALSDNRAGGTAAPIGDESHRSAVACSRVSCLRLNVRARRGLGSEVRDGAAA